MSIAFIRIISKNTNVRDDTIRMARESDTNKILVTYTTGASQKKHTLHLTESTTLPEYVGSLVRTIRTDSDPAGAVQFEFPGFPVVLYSMTKLKKKWVFANIREMARIAEDSWFADLDSQSGSGSTESDDSTSISSEDSDSTTYDDLPHLIDARVLPNLNRATHQIWRD